MRKTILFIAMSLDGYIADGNGRVDWLNGHDNNEKTESTDDSYDLFMKDVDTVIMGRTTYNQIVTDLSPDVWPYESLTTYVITHRKSISTEQIRFTDETPADLINRLRYGKGKDIWICGGADIVQQLLRANLIDRFHIFLIPVLLGDGVRLFDSTEKELKLTLIKTQNDSGIVELIYERRQQHAFFADHQ